MWQYKETTEFSKKRSKRLRSAKSQDRSGATLGKESNSSAGGDRSPGSYSKRPQETSENPGTCQNITKPTPKGSIARHSTHPAKIPLRFPGPWRGLEL